MSNSSDHSVGDGNGPAVPEDSAEPVAVNGIFFGPSHPSILTEPQSAPFVCVLANLTKTASEIHALTGSKPLWQGWDSSMPGFLHAPPEGTQTQIPSDVLWLIHHIVCLRLRGQSLSGLQSPRP